MSFVYLDTQVLVWGIKREATPGQEGMVLRAEHFLRWIEENAIQVAVPAVVFGELLLRVPEDRHAERSLHLLERCGSGKTGRGLH